MGKLREYKQNIIFCFCTIYLAQLIHTINFTYLQHFICFDLALNRYQHLRWRTFYGYFGYSIFR